MCGGGGVTSHVGVSVSQLRLLSLQQEAGHRKQSRALYIITISISGGAAIYAIRR